MSEYVLMTRFFKGQSLAEIEAEFHTKYNRQRDYVLYEGDCLMLKGGYPLAVRRTGQPAFINTRGPDPSRRALYNRWKDFQNIVRGQLRMDSYVRFSFDDAMRYGLMSDFKGLNFVARRPAERLPFRTPCRSQHCVEGVPDVVGGPPHPHQHTHEVVVEGACLLYEEITRFYYIAETSRPIYTAPDTPHLLCVGTLPPEIVAANDDTSSDPVLRALHKVWPTSVSRSTLRYGRWLFQPMTGIAPVKGPKKRAALSHTNYSYATHEAEHLIKVDDSVYVRGKIYRDNKYVFEVPYNVWHRVTTLSTLHPYLVSQYRNEIQR